MVSILVLLCKRPQSQHVRDKQETNRSRLYVQIEAKTKQPSSLEDEPLRNLQLALPTAAAVELPLLVQADLRQKLQSLRLTLAVVGGLRCAFDLPGRHVHCCLNCVSVYVCVVCCCWCVSVCVCVVFGVRLFYLLSFCVFLFFCVCVCLFRFDQPWMCSLGGLH